MDIFNSRSKNDPYAEYTDESLRDFLESEFMQTLFIECERNKAKLSKLICEYLSDGQKGKDMGTELFKVYEDFYSEKDQLEMLQDFKKNYLAQNSK